MDVVTLVKRNVIKIKPNKSQIVEVFNEKIKNNISLVHIDKNRLMVFS